MLKYFILAWTILFSLSIALPLEEGFTCPVDDCKISQCLYVNPDKCNTFWQCTSDGRAYLQICPAGLEFNDFIKVCDWPSSQTCIPGLQPTPRPSSTSTTEQEPIETTTEITTEITKDSTEETTETSTTEGTTEQAISSDPTESVTLTVTPNDEIST